MSKEIFRFLQKELNGKSFNALNKSNIDYSAKYKEMLLTIHNLQFTEDMEDKYLKEIGAIIGIFNIFTLSKMRNTALYMTFGEHNYNDRGLYNTQTEEFEFIRQDAETYPTDINTEANKEKRTSMVEKGATVKGYIAYGDNVLDETGSVDESKLRSTPPTDNTAYNAYYGDKYLFISNIGQFQLPLPNSVYYDILIILQRIRRNGENIVDLIELCNILCGDFLMIQSINFYPYGYWGYLDYTIAEGEFDRKNERLGALEIMIKLKFPMLEMREVV